MTRPVGKTAFVFAGGGSLGAIQVGMLRALLLSGVKPDFVIGTSVGALNASFFAGAPNIEGVTRLEHIWAGLRRADIFPFTFATAFGVLRHSGHVASPHRLRRLIEQHLPYALLQDSELPVHVTATDTNGRSVCLSRGPAVEAVLASTAIPCVFPHVLFDDKTLMDGCIAANTPIRIAAELGASRIFVLSTGYACALREPPKGIIARALHAVTLMIASQIRHDLEWLPKNIEIYAAPTICPLNVSPYDFTSSKMLIDEAARLSQNWIEGGGLTRRALPQEFSPHNHNH